MKPLAKTLAGQQAFKARSPLLSARQRSIFLMFDGVKSVDQVLTATSGLGATAQDIDHLVRQGFLAVFTDALASSTAISTVEEVAVVDPEPLAGSSLSPQARYSLAMPLATKATASLGLRGFMLNLAVESASGFDDLLALFPKIQAAVGREACAELERALKG